MKISVPLRHLVLLLMFALFGSVTILPAQTGASTFTRQGRLKARGAAGTTVRSVASVRTVEVIN